MLKKIKALLTKKPAVVAAEPNWITIAKKEIGVKEVRGGENARIIEYHSTCTLKATEDEVAWCSAFVNWVMLKAGCERTHMAAARSWLGIGPKLPGFKKYAIVVFKRGDSKWQGHVAFAIDDLGSSIRVLGGNQHDAVCYAVYKKSNVLGYFWPKAEAQEVKRAV